MKEDENCQEIDWEFKFNIIMCLQLGNTDVNEIKVQTIKLVLYKQKALTSINLKKIIFMYRVFHVSKFTQNAEMSSYSVFHI